jgi:hypothetical protein
MKYIIKLLRNKTARCSLIYKSALSGENSLLNRLGGSVFMLLFILLIGGVAGCGNSAPNKYEPAASETANLKPAEKAPVYGPLNHMLLDEEKQKTVLKRPIIITIDNFSKARPQAGISRADIMYELPAEGGISRYLAVFYCGFAETAGPIRSARPYLIDVAKSYGGVYVHSGGSPDALNYLSRSGWPYINEFAYGAYFWRDKSRRPPHNLYTGIDKLTELINSKGWNDKKIAPTPFLFLSPVDKVEGEKTHTIEINYPYTRNTYVYDENNRSYQRKINDEFQMDALDGQYVWVANVIVQKVKSKVLDSEGRLEINMKGQGEAILFTRGIVREGSWEQRGDERAVFRDGETGLEWRLSPGQTWIQVCDGSVKIHYEYISAEENQQEGIRE